MFFQYQFTSFASVILHRTGCITNMWKHLQEGREELLLRDSKTENINSDNTQYNIAYTIVHYY